MILLLSRQVTKTHLLVKSTNLRRMKRVRRTLNTNIPVFSLGAKQDACFMIYLLKIKEGENAGGGATNSITVGQNDKVRK